MKNKLKFVSTIFFKQLIRDKVFLLFVSAAILLIFASLILNKMIVGQDVKAIKDLGLTVLNIFSLFILIFLGINHFSKDLNKKLHYFLFSKPIERSEYLIGNFLSMLFTVIFFILIIVFTIFILSFIKNEIWISGLLTAGYLTLLEMILLLSFAVLFAISVSPRLAMFLTLLIYVTGHTIEKVTQIVDKSSNLVLKYSIIVLNVLLPNLEFFNKKTEIVYGMEIPFLYFLYSTIYSVSYTLLIFLISIFIFRRKNI